MARCCARHENRFLLPRKRGGAQAKAEWALLRALFEPAARKEVLKTLGFDGERSACGARCLLLGL